MTFLRRWVPWSGLGRWPYHNTPTCRIRKTLGCPHANQTRLWAPRVNGLMTPPPKKKVIESNAKETKEFKG